MLQIILDSHFKFFKAGDRLWNLQVTWNFKSHEQSAGGASERNQSLITTTSYLCTKFLIKITLRLDLSFQWGSNFISNAFKCIIYTLTIIFIGILYEWSFIWILLMFGLINKQSFLLDSPMLIINYLIKWLQVWKPTEQIGFVYL